MDDVAGCEVPPALGLAAAGRTGLLEDFDGPGLPALRTWATT